MRFCPTRCFRRNALIESKNGSFVRKHIENSHIPERWAPLVNQFHKDYLNPYINYHRPCFFPVTKEDARGKRRKMDLYKAMMRPFAKFLSQLRSSQYHLAIGIYCIACIMEAV